LILRALVFGLVLGSGEEDIVMIPSNKRSETPERPITFNAAENLGAFQLAELWAEPTAWPISERTAYDELAELATMSALAKWLTWWQPIAIHGAVLAGARIEAIAGALGNSLEAAFDLWYGWASEERDFICNGKPGITDDEYEAVARRFAAVGIEAHTEDPPTDAWAGAS
jgi:hypothetical protein